MTHDNSVDQPRKMVESLPDDGAAVFIFVHNRHMGLHVHDLIRRLRGENLAQMARIQVTDSGRSFAQQLRGRDPRRIFVDDVALATMTEDDRILFEACMRKREACPAI